MTTAYYYKQISSLRYLIYPLLYILGKSFLRGVLHRGPVNNIFKFLVLLGPG